MSATVVPGDLDAQRGPPLRIPLAHFLLGVALLVPAAALWLAAALDAAPAYAGVARRHLLLTGWVCVTIAGAMTQFVPVWSGVPLHSRRLAALQAWLLGAGLIGFVACLLAGRLDVVWLAAVALLAGFGTFAYNMARTLATARPFDVTEAHFALALGFLCLAVLAGFGLAVGFVTPVADRRGVGLGRLALRNAHVTLAVLGVIVTTVIGALYQLAPMFAVADPDQLDRRLRRVETVAYPAGVVTLAAGRLAGASGPARVGALAVAGGLVAVVVVLARTLLRGRGEWSPTTRRYAVVVPALVTWLALAIPTWLADPLSPTGVLGGPAAAAALSLGVFGFVVTGSLYHVVPFLVWVDRYSDRLGLADVPMVDDLYDGRLAAADGACLCVAAIALTAAPLLVGRTAAVGVVSLVGGAAAVAAAGLFATNLFLIVQGHVEGGVVCLVTGASDTRDAPDAPDVTD
jgi:hypothetical protein